MKTYQWIWQHPHWPQLVYNIKTLFPQLTALNRLIGAPEIASGSLAEDELLDARKRVLTNDVLASAIEGEILHSPVRASIRKRLGLPVDQDDADRHTDALAVILLDAREGTDSPLTEQ